MRTIPAIKSLACIAVAAAWGGCSSGLQEEKSPSDGDTAEGDPTGSSEDSEAPESDDSGSGTTESLPGMPTIAGACPSQTFSMQDNVGLPDRWELDQYQVEPLPLDNLGIRTEVLEAPIDWWFHFLQDMDGYDHWFSEVVTDIQVIQAGDYRFRMTPIDVFGQAGAPIECEVEFMWLGAFGVELSGDPASTGGWELHLVADDGELFERETDLSWCNRHIEAGDPTSREDDLHFTSYSGGSDNPEYSFQFAIAHVPPPAVYTVYVYNEDIGRELVDGEWGNYQVEARVFMGGELQLEARARILRGMVWEVGTIDLHTMTFTESTAPHFEPTGPTYCH